MRTIAAYTLGCKVNQYDTEAMLEAFERAGYVPVPFGEEADVYLINTCTVTGTGDQKSLKTVRRMAQPGCSRAMRRTVLSDFWSPVPVPVQVLIS